MMILETIFAFLKELLLLFVFKGVWRDSAGHLQGSDCASTGITPGG